MGLNGLASCCSIVPCLADYCTSGVGLDFDLVLSHIMLLVGSIIIIQIIVRRQLLPFIFFDHLDQMGYNFALTPVRLFRSCVFHLALVSSLTVHFLLYIKVPEAASPFSGLEQLNSLMRKEELHFETPGELVAVHIHYSHSLSVPKVLYFPLQNDDWLVVDSNLSVPNSLDSQHHLVVTAADRHSVHINSVPLNFGNGNFIHSSDCGFCRALSAKTWLTEKLHCHGQEMASNSHGFAQNGHLAVEADFLSDCFHVDHLVLGCLWHQCFLKCDHGLVLALALPLRFFY